MVTGKFLVSLWVVFVFECALASQGVWAQSGLRDYNSHSPFVAPESLNAWRDRAEDIRLQVQVATGVHPAISLPKVQPEIYGLVRRDGFSVQRIVFDSLPGLSVTGSLFLPDPMPVDPVPGVLCPHGHWEEARFRAAPDDEVKRELATGAERFENAARHHIQARCVQLARMGCAVLHWDMIGYCDSKQISFDRSHRFARQDRKFEADEDGWLLFSPEAELRAQSVMGLQTIATRRVVDALLTLDFIDPDRIAITGASGGGTQSFIGAALDERIAIAFPAVMVSTGMQGGCTCENAALLRVGTSNAEIAALIAPRPLGMTAANDWTRDMQQDGFPQIRAVYELLGHPADVRLYPALHFGHNFNHVSRVAMYGWLNKYLRLELEEPVLEQDFQPVLPSDLTVWDARHSTPPGGVGFERELMRRWDQLNLEAFAAGSEQEQHLWWREGWRVMLGDASAALNSQVDDKGDMIVWDQPSLGQWSMRATEASSTTIESLGQVSVSTNHAPLRTYTFDALSEGPQQLVDNPRLAAGYTYGYNLTHFARQSQRLAVSLRDLMGGRPVQEGVKADGGAPITVVARGSAAAVALAAVLSLQLSGVETGEIELEVDAEGFDFSDVTSIRDPVFQPAAMKYGGVTVLEQLVEEGQR